MKKTINKWSLVGIMLLLVAAIPAFGADQDLVTADLQARYARVECHATLAESQAESLGDYISGTELGTAKDKLVSDMTALNAYADAGNRTDFQEYMTKTIQPDIRDVHTALKDTKKGFKDLSKENKKNVRDAWKQAVAAFADCNNNAKRSIIGSRKKIVDAHTDAWGNTIASMKSKGLSSEKLESIMAEAKTLYAKLEDAATATDDELKDKINEVQDLHLHLWARFHIAKIESYVAKVEQVAVAAGQGAKIDEIKALLGSASALAESGHKYNPGEFEQVHQAIKDAAERLRDLVKELKLQSSETR